MMTLDDAVDLVLYAFEHGEQGDLFVQKAPAATIETLAKAIIDLTGSKTVITYIGTRHGEQLYETLVTQEEMVKSVDLGNFFCVKADNRDLNYDKYFSKGNKKLDLGEPYTSHSTKRLDVDGMKQLLKKLELFGGEVKQHE
jgi:UDP-glucose 4-epimerase